MEKLSPRNLSPKSHSLVPKLQSLNAISLPILTQPRGKADALLSTERERIKQKLKNNYYKNDVSYLQKGQTQREKTDQVSLFLSTDITEIFNSIYKTNVQNLEILNLPPPKRTKSPSKTFLDKILSPRYKSIVPCSYKFQISAPTNRQEAINLENWLNIVEEKYVVLFKNLLSSKGSFDRNQVIQAWKAIYTAAALEVSRQIGLNCNERGKVIGKVVEGYEKVFQVIFENAAVELQCQEEAYKRSESENIEVMAKRLAFAQEKYEELEKDRAEVIEMNDRLIEQVQYLEKELKKIKTTERGGARPGGKINFYQSGVAFTENIAKIKGQLEKKPLNISERLIRDISGKLKKLLDVKAKAKTQTNLLQDLEIEIQDKQCILSSVTFEISLKQQLVPTIAKFTQKVNTSSIFSMKKTAKIPKLPLKFEKKQLKPTDFFKKLTEKSYARLINKGKVPQDHIFQSISVIYNRAMSQIENGGELLDFSSLVYSQFVSIENKSKSEKILKVFIGACLKFSDFKRVSVFLRFLGLGTLVNCCNFSRQVLTIYLSVNMYMQSSSIGILIHKEFTNPIQYYPYARAVSCVNDLKSVFPDFIAKVLHLHLETIKTSDPKQINPQGMIELESFLEKVSEVHEDLSAEIKENCISLYKAVSENDSLPSITFKRLLTEIHPDWPIPNFLADLSGVSLATALEISSNFYLFRSESLKNYLGDLTSASVKDLISSSKSSSEVFQILQKNIESISPFYLLLWWKLLIS